MVSARLESVLIGDEVESELLAFRGHPVDGALLCVTGAVAVILAVSVLAGVSGELLLGVGFLAGGVVRLGIATFVGYNKSMVYLRGSMFEDIPPCPASVHVAHI